MASQTEMDMKKKNLKSKWTNAVSLTLERESNYLQLS